MTIITLRPHQVAAADAVEQAWRDGIKRPLIDACVASGKSLIFAELARREIERGGRSIIGSHTRELVDQNAGACRALMPGVHVGVNAAALGERVWRAPVISAAIQSVYKNAAAFGPVTSFFGDEAHLWPHAESGMYRGLVRDLGDIRLAGASGTTFRLQGGSLVEGEGAPFDRVVYRYTITDGIRDGYLCPAFSLTAQDKLDPSKLRMSKGEYTGDSQDAQAIAAMDNHIAQMVHLASDRRAWLVFEASTKSATAMCARMNEWGIPTGLVLGKTPAGERAAAIAAFRAGRLRALVNINGLTTGFDAPEADLLVMRRRTKSIGLYIQMAGRILRTIGGHIDKSIAAGKSDGAVLDFAGNIDEHGPLDFIRPKESKPRLVACDECGARNGGAARNCWKCDAVMTKLCPACLENISKQHLDCPHCSYDMRQQGERADPTTKLLATPSGAALLKAYAKNTDRAGGWQAVLKCYSSSDGIILDTQDRRVILPALLEAHAPLAKWIRFDDETVAGLLIPNGASRTTALQIDIVGRPLIVPLPVAEAVR